MKKTKLVIKKIDITKLPQKPGKRTASKCSCGQCPDCQGYGKWADAEIARAMEKDD